MLATIIALSSASLIKALEFQKLAYFGYILFFIQHLNIVYRVTTNSFTMFESITQNLILHSQLFLPLLSELFFIFYQITIFRVSFPVDGWQFRICNLLSFFVLAFQYVFVKVVRHLSFSICFTCSIWFGLFWCHHEHHWFGITFC